MQNIHAHELLSRLRNLTNENWKIRKTYHHRARGNGVTVKKFRIWSDTAEGTIEEHDKVVVRVELPEHVRLLCA